MNKGEAAKIVAMLQAHEPKHETTDATVEVWAMALDDVPYPAAMFAVRSWIKNHKWFPFPSELRELIATQLTGLPDTDIAWGMVQARMRATYPGHTAPAWDAHPAVKEATGLVGGVNTLRMSNQPGKDQEHFAKVYNAIRERTLQDADIPRLWRELADGLGGVAIADGPKPSFEIMGRAS